MLTQSLDQRDLCARTGLGSCLGGPLLTSPHGPYGCTRSFIWWIILLSLGYVTRPLKSRLLQDLLSRHSETLSKLCIPPTKTIISAPPQHYLAMLFRKCFVCCRQICACILKDRVFLSSTDGRKWNHMSFDDKI